MAPVAFGTTKQSKAPRITQNSRNHLAPHASSIDRNRVTFEHSSRSRPLNDSMWPLRVLRPSFRERERGVRHARSFTALVGVGSRPFSHALGDGFGVARPVHNLSSDAGYGLDHHSAAPRRRHFHRPARGPAGDQAVRLHRCPGTRAPGGEPPSPSVSSRRSSRTWPCRPASAPSSPGRDASRSCGMS